MNDLGLGIAVLLASYTAIGVSMAFLVQKSGKRFIIAGKRLPLLIVGTMLFAQALDANSTVGSAGAVQAGGFWTGFTFPLGLALCLVVTGTWFAKPLNRMNMLTLADFYYRRYSNRVEIPVTFIMAISFIILVAGNLAGCGWIVKTVFGIEYVPALVVVTGLVLLYTFSGGLFSSAATDIVQLYPALIAFIAAPLILIGNYGIDFFAAAIPAGYADLSGLTSIESGALINWAGILALALGDIVALDFMERVFAAKDEKTAQAACYYGAIFTIIAGLGATVLGLMTFALFPVLDDPRDALGLIATNELPFIVGLFVLGGVLGAGSVHRERWRTRRVGRLRAQHPPPEHHSSRTSAARPRRWARRSRSSTSTGTCLTSGCSRTPGSCSSPSSGRLWLAIVRPEPGVMLVLAFDVVFAGCLVPLVLGIYWSKANTSGALASIIIGSGLRLLFFLGIPALEPGLDTLIPPVVSLIAMVAVSSATYKTDVPKHHVITEVATDENVARGLA